MILFRNLFFLNPNQTFKMVLYMCQLHKKNILVDLFWYLSDFIHSFK